MMVILPPQTINMQRNARILRKRSHTMRNHLATQIAYFLSLQAQIYDAVGAVGKVYYGTGKGFVEGTVGGAEAGEAR